MQTYSGRWVFLPYCIKRLEDGRYIVLNRLHKPLGVSSSAWVVYEEHPSAAAMKITPSKAKRMSCRESDDVSVIHLYKDECIPDGGKAEHLDAYVRRLKVLMSLEVEANLLTPSDPLSY